MSSSPPGCTKNGAVVRDGVVKHGRRRYRPRRPRVGIVIDRAEHIDDSAGDRQLGAGVIVEAAAAKAQDGAIAGIDIRAIAGGTDDFQFAGLHIDEPRVVQRAREYQSAMTMARICPPALLLLMSDSIVPLPSTMPVFNSAVVPPASTGRHRA